MSNIEEHYTFKFKAKNFEALTVLPNPVYVQNEEIEDIDKMIEKFLEDRTPLDTEGPFEFVATKILVTSEVVQTQDFVYQPIPKQEEGVIKLQALTREEVEKIIKEHGRSWFCLAPQGVNPLIESAKFWLGRLDFEESGRILNSGGAPLTKLDIKIGMLNEVQFHRADDAPIDFYCLQEGEEGRGKTNE